MPNSWDTIKESLRGRLAAEDYQIWIEPLKPAPKAGGRLALGCPNSFHLRWVRDHYLPVLRQAAHDAGVSISLEAAQTMAGETRPPGPCQMELPHLGAVAPTLNRRFVFDSFVPGGCNEFALAAAKALAEGQKLFSNTLFLVSDTGLGKSHLTQAVGHFVLSNSGPARVAYLTAEDFANQMISALRKKRMEAFKERFRRACDVLLLEGVQFLAGKEKTQDELAYTLDALCDAGRRVVFTGYQPPDQIKGLKPALVSRLAAGVTIPIAPPDRATRAQILRRQAQAEGVSVAPVVLDYLAQEIAGDVRRLQAALVGLMAKGSLTRRPMDISLAAEVLGQMHNARRRLGLGDIRDLVAKVYGMDAGALTGKSRRKDITRPRNLAMFLCRKHTEASFAAIGSFFNRDHATVMYGVDKIERDLAIDHKLAQELDYLNQRLTAEM